MEQVPDIRFNRICSELVIGNKAIASKTGPMRIPDFNSGGGCKADPSCLRAFALTLDRLQNGPKLFQGFPFKS